MYPAVLRHRLVLPAIALFLAGGLLWLVLGAAASSWDAPCLSCHSANRPNSAHESVGCSRCHTERGELFGALNGVMLAEEISAQLFGATWSSGTRVRNDACLRCHDVEEPLRAAGVRMSHKEVLDAGWRCSDCHLAAGHGSSVGVPMSRCTPCHNGETASSQCGTCHLERDPDEARKHDPEWSITHGPNWRQTHGMGTLSGCSACHEPSMCRRCHKTDLPHPDAFGATHSAEARRARESCLSCHRSAFCENCHGMEMPHPASFLAEHWDRVEEHGPLSCDRCHVQAQCDECHGKHAHPGRIDRLRAPSGMYREQEL